MNAGLAMKCTVAAVRCVITATNAILVDPSDKDVAEGDGDPAKAKARADFTFVFESVHGQSVACHCVGRYSAEEMQEALKVATAASQKMFAFYRDSLRRFTKIL